MVTEGAISYTVDGFLQGYLSIDYSISVLSGLWSNNVGDNGDPPLDVWERNLRSLTSPEGEATTAVTTLQNEDTETTPPVENVLSNESNDEISDVSGLTPGSNERVSDESVLLRGEAIEEEPQIVDNTSAPPSAALSSATSGGANQDLGTDPRGDTNHGNAASTETTTGSADAADDATLTGNLQTTNNSNDNSLSGQQSETDFRNSTTDSLSGASSLVYSYNTDASLPGSNNNSLSGQPSATNIHNSTTDSLSMTHSSTTGASSLLVGQHNTDNEEGIIADEDTNLNNTAERTDVPEENATDSTDAQDELTIENTGTVVEGTNYAAVPDTNGAGTNADNTNLDSTTEHTDVQDVNANDNFDAQEELTGRTDVPDGNAHDNTDAQEELTGPGVEGTDTGTGVEGTVNAASPANNNRASADQTTEKGACCTIL